jgi:hypothetical protein
MLEGRWALGPPFQAAPGPRRASPVPTATFWSFHAPYAGGFLGTRSKIPGAFHGLRRCCYRLGSPFAPLARVILTTLQASLDVADRPVAPPRFATGDLGVSPDRTRTGWSP